MQTSDTAKEPRNLLFAEEILNRSDNWDFRTHNVYDLIFEGNLLSQSRFSVDLSSVSVHKTIRLEPAWQPRFIYVGSYPVIIIQFVHENGEVAVWFVSADFDFLAGRPWQLPPDTYRRLCVALRSAQAEGERDGLSYLDELVRRELPWFPHPHLDRLRHGRARSTVSLCYSGQPRMFMKYRHLWTQFYDEIREVCDLRIFFHAWAQQGLVRKIGGEFREGNYEHTIYRDFDSLIDFLQPQNFAVEYAAPEFEHEVASFPPVSLWTSQASKYYILSQLYSVTRADSFRQHYDQAHGVSDAVLRLRFDALPIVHRFREIAYVATNPDIPILFAPAPHAHGHPGGGGGCLACTALFSSHSENGAIWSHLKAHFATHAWHSNDICDIYAIASSRVMSRYATIFWSARTIWERIAAISALMPEPTFPARPDHHNPVDRRFETTTQHLEESFHAFYPEKLLRFGMNDVLVVHSEAEFRITRE
jgi:hypothetical protein